MKRVVLTSLLASLLSFSCATASAAGQSNPSQASANLSGVVVFGSVLSVAAAGSVVVASVKTVGDGLEIVVESLADGSRATLRLSGAVAGGLSVAAGTAVEVVMASTGQVLVLSGKAIAFIPNEVGKALLHHARVG